ncbi:VanZ family protein [Candidatus Kuenenia sp.]|uniref:VanZ family protein n=1 Tax=Candidatus Kuenenia sp. TaxID=2499824 RepID=UPI00321FE1C3
MTKKIKIHWGIKCALAFGYACGIYVASSTDTSSVSLPNHIDKLIHFVEYGILCLFVCWVVSSFQIKSVKMFYLLTIGITSLYGMFDEFHQSFTPNRSADVLDWLADTAGAATACFLWHVFIRKNKVSNRLLTDR